MKQEDKELLLKDLCGRLPYGVICKDDYVKVEGKLVQIGINYDMCLLSDDYGKTEFAYILNCKPYLFPLSSMTYEIIDEIYSNAGVYDICVDSSVHIEIGTKFEDLSKVFDILHKYHIDYRNLIEKGLAIDATRLNIY